MSVVYIHGANATGRSFNYLREKIGAQQELILEYNSSLGFEHNLQLMSKTLCQTQDICFIAHSMGGIYALHLANLLPGQVKSAVTMSTPYGGVEAADLARFFLPHNRLIKDVATGSWPIRQAHKISVPVGWTNIVTTQGSCIWMAQPNDGVVSIASQTCLKDRMDLVEINCNHYEVLLDHLALDTIKQRLI